MSTSIEFVSSVPVAGMEESVSNVGKKSVRWGSKFPLHKIIENQLEVATIKKEISICKWNRRCQTWYIR
jgi:hypothetical protein